MAREIIKAIQLLFAKKKYLFLALFVMMLLFFLLIMVPVWTTPGNDFLFQMELMGVAVVVFLVLLSLLNGILFSMQVYIWREMKMVSKNSAFTFSGAVGGFLVSIFSCAACYSSIIAFAGLGLSSFFIKYRWLILSLAFLLVLWAIYNSSKQINGHCEVCKVVLK